MTIFTPFDHTITPMYTRYLYIHTAYIPNPPLNTLYTSLYTSLHGRYDMPAANFNSFLDGLTVLFQLFVGEAWNGILQVPMYTRYTCIFTIYTPYYTPNTPLNTPYTPYIRPKTTYYTGTAGL